ncbi:MAG: protein rep [Candidatus Rokuibacteriota bacterium]
MCVYQTDKYDGAEAGDDIYESYNPPSESEQGSPVAVSLDPLPKTRQEHAQKARERGFAYRNHQSTIEQLDHWLEERCSDGALAKRIRACGTDAWVEESPSTGRWRIRCKRCGSRLCPVCRIRWSLRQRDRINSVLADVKPNRRKLLTLTLRSSSAPLQLQIHRLWSSYNKLKHLRLWKKHVDGAIAVLEVTWNEESSQWHPHLHCVLDSSFFEQKQVSRAWLRITLDSKIVDIRAVKSFEKAAAYLTKYLLKTLVLPAEVDPARLDELYAMHQKTRLVRFHGTLRPNPFEELWKPPYPTDWTPRMPLLDFLTRLDEGEPRARAIADKIGAERIFAQEAPTDWNDPP